MSVNNEYFWLLLNFMWSISRITERDQITKTTVFNHFKRFVECHGPTVTLYHLVLIALVNVVQYDSLWEEYGDASKAQALRREDDGARGRRCLCTRGGGLGGGSSGGPRLAQGIDLVRFG